MAQPKTEQSMAEKVSDGVISAIRNNNGYDNARLEAFQAMYNQLRGALDHASRKDGELLREKIRQKKGKKRAYSVRNDSEYWYYIQSSDSIIRMLYGIHKYYREILGRQPRFLDIGAGAGNVVRLASAMGYLSAGLEFNSDFRKYYGKYSISFLNHDMFEFTSYKQYDVLYAYQPLTCGKKMVDFIDNVLYPKMKSGAIFLFYDASVTPKSEKFHQIMSTFSHRIYYKP